MSAPLIAMWDPLLKRRSRRPESRPPAPEEIRPVGRHCAQLGYPSPTTRLSCVRYSLAATRAAVKKSTLVLDTVPLPESLGAFRGSGGTCPGRIPLQHPSRRTGRVFSSTVSGTMTGSAWQECISCMNSRYAAVAALPAGLEQLLPSGRLRPTYAKPRDMNEPH